MDLIFVTNARFSKARNGHIYGYHTSLKYATFLPYLKVFDRVKIIARVEATGDSFEESLRIDLDNIEILPVPYFLGPKQYITKAYKIRSVIRGYVKGKEAIICRIPGTLGRLAANEAKKIKKPYGVEVAADPFDVFASGSFKHPLRPFLKYFATSQLRKNLLSASAAIYVTAHQLQTRYPVRKGVFQTYASNVILPPDAFAPFPKKWKNKKDYTIVVVGSLSQMYKAPDVLIRALNEIREGNSKVRLTLYWLGGGKFKSEMVELAASLNMSDDIYFEGLVHPTEKVREYLDKADLFVLPSRTEGLPRAMIEAMARGLPCIGTDVGGIPELLPTEAMIPINSHQSLALKIEEFLINENSYNINALKNFEKSQEFSSELLDQRKVSFYKKVKELALDYNSTCLKK